MAVSEDQALIDSRRAEGPGAHEVARVRVPETGWRTTCGP